MCVLITQLRPTLCGPMDYSPPGSSVHGILQARTLERVAISSFRGFPWPRYWTQVSCIAGTFFTIWLTRESLVYNTSHTNNILKSNKQTKFFFYFYRTLKRTAATSPLLLGLLLFGKISWELRFCWEVWDSLGLKWRYWTTVVYTALHSQGHKSSTPCRGCTHLTMCSRHVS